MRSPWLRKRGVIVLVGAAALLAAGGWWWPMNRPTTNTAESPRARYAALYDGAWRQDQGRGSQLVTATLLVPPAITALGQDDGRSSVETQLWDAVKDLSPRALAFLVTVDSVNGAIPDQQMIERMALTASSGQTFVVDRWLPFIAPTRVVNTSQSVTSQVGALLFTTDQPIDWINLGTLELVARQLGDQPTRIFSWPEPRTIIELP